MKRLAQFILIFAGVVAVEAQTNAVRVTVDASEVVRTVDARWFGVNAAVWDGLFDTTNTLAALREAGISALRFPGGSASDEYHWAENRSGTNQWRWATSFDQFAHIATNLGAQVFITVNYGSGTPEEAAAWVRYANITNHYNFKYWEIGNENYGSWEHDDNSPPHDPVVYATRAKDFFAAMHAADPTIKIGVVVTDTEDKHANYTNHPVVNPRTGQSHNGWTPGVLSTLKKLGMTPDFAIYHRYPQNAGEEDDAKLLRSTAKWTADAADLRQQLKDYLGDAGANVELVCTENNSVSSGTGKQTTSLVNGLYLADSFGRLAQTEFGALVWWDWRNGRDTQSNNSSKLYGWRLFGDYGMLLGRTNRYPTFYAEKLLQHFARGGDKIIRATSDNELLSTYAARCADGSLTLLVINKSPTNAFTPNFSIAGFQPGNAVTFYAYGIPQDDAARTGVGSPDILQKDFSHAAANFNYLAAPYSATIIAISPDGGGKK